MTTRLLKQVRSGAGEVAAALIGCMLAALLVHAIGDRSDAPMPAAAAPIAQVDDPAASTEEPWMDPASYAFWAP